MKAQKVEDGRSRLNSPLRRSWQFAVEIMPSRLAQGSIQHQSRFLDQSAPATDVCVCVYIYIYIYLFNRQNFNICIRNLDTNKERQKNKHV